MCDLFYLAVIQTRYRQKWYLRILCKSPIISIKMRFTLWSAILFLSLIGRTVYFRNRSLPIFKMCRSTRKNLSIYDLEKSYLGKCLNDHYLRVAMHQTTNEWAQRTSEFLMHLNTWIKIVQALCGIFSIKCVVGWYFVTVRCYSVFDLLSACRKLKILATELHCKFKIKYIHLHMYEDKVCTSRKKIFQSIKRSSEDASLQTFI